MTEALMTDPIENSSDDAGQPRSGITRSAETIDSFAFFRIADLDRLLEVSDALIAELPVSEATRRLVTPEAVAKRTDAHMNHAAHRNIPPLAFNRKRLINWTRKVLREMDAKSEAALLSGSSLRSLLWGETRAELIYAFSERFELQIKDEYVATYGDFEDPGPQRLVFEERFPVYLDRLLYGMRLAKLVDRRGPLLDAADPARGIAINVCDFTGWAFGLKSEKAKRRRRKQKKNPGKKTREALRQWRRPSLDARTSECNEVTPGQAFDFVRMFDHLLSHRAFVSLVVSNEALCRYVRHADYRALKDKTKKDADRFWVNRVIHSIVPQDRKDREAAEVMNLIPECAKKNGPWTAKTFADRRRRTLQKIDEFLESIE